MISHAGNDNNIIHRVQAYAGSVLMSLSYTWKGDVLGD